MPGTTWEHYTSWDNILDACDYKCRCKRACKADITCPKVLAACKEACKKKKSNRPRSGWDFYYDQPLSIRNECESNGWSVIEHDEPTMKICQQGMACNSPIIEERESIPPNHTPLYLALGIIIFLLIIYLIFL